MIVRWGLEQLPEVLADVGSNRPFAIASDRWHDAYGPAVAEWLRAVGGIEALGALATFAYELPDDPFPEGFTVGDIWA